MDLTPTIEPKSDQINADDLLAGPLTFTVEKVSQGSPEQPINIHLAENPGRPYRPSKSMRRVLVGAWGKDGDAYAGRRLTLYRNPEIKFGGSVVGGIEISHMSHLDKPLNVPLTVTRGKKKNFTVTPLVEAEPRDWEAEINAADMEGLRALWSVAPDEHKPAITAKVNALKETGADG